MTQPYYTSIPKCKPCKSTGVDRIATYVVYNAKSRLNGVYCLECARRKVDALREMHDVKEKRIL